MKSSRKDFTQVAVAVAQIATGEAEKPKPLAGKKASSSKGGEARKSYKIPQEIAKEK